MDIESRLRRINDANNNKLTQNHQLIELLKEARQVSAYRWYHTAWYHLIQIALLAVIAWKLF
jgi:hypothetical protein